MPNYGYRICRVQDGKPRRDTDLSPHSFAGAAEEFARATLRDVVAGLRPEDEEYIAVDVWDLDRPGAGTEDGVAARIDSDNLALEEFPDRMEIDHYTYYVISDAHDNITEDEVLGGLGTDVTHGVPFGLVVPGSGPAAKIRTGHQFGYITLEVRVLGAEPALDDGDAGSAGWEAIEQFTLRPGAEVRVCNDRLEPQDRFPGLTGGQPPEFLAVRVSARGRDACPGDRGNLAGSQPLEWHRIETWPLTRPEPRVVFRRDATTRYWESQGPDE